MTPDAAAGHPPASSSVRDADGDPQAVRLTDADPPQRAICQAADGILQLVQVVGEDELSGCAESPSIEPSHHAPDHAVPPWSLLERTRMAEVPFPDTGGPCGDLAVSFVRVR